jgi:predicted nicotinamide N-methyase
MRLARRARVTRPSLDALRRRFEVAESEVVIGGRAMRIRHPRDAEALIDEEAFARDERLPYWADIWPSAVVLAEHVASLGGAGRTLLELGCGLGVVAAAAARAGFVVTATDYYDDALAFAAINVAENAGAALATRMVDWKSLPADLGRFDVVVASDVLYERPYAALVADAFARTLAPGGEGWLADPGRIAAPMFESEARARGLTIARAKQVPFEVAQQRQRIAIYEIRRASQ